MAGYGPLIVCVENVSVAESSQALAGPDNVAADTEDVAVSPPQLDLPGSRPHREAGQTEGGAQGGEAPELNFRHRSVL